MSEQDTTKSRIRTNWTLLSNHGHVLVCIAGDPDIRLRDISARVGITERAVFGIVEDLEAGGVIRRVKIGRRNRYEIMDQQPLRHPIEADRTIGALLGLFTGDDESGETSESDADRDSSEATTCA